MKKNVLATLGKITYSDGLSRHSFVCGLPLSTVSTWGWEFRLPSSYALIGLLFVASSLVEVVVRDLYGGVTAEWIQREFGERGSDGV